MSGGSLDYVCYKVGDAADFIAKNATTPLQRAFAAHLCKVSEALHDIEWVMSGDYGEGDEVAAITACLHNTAELEQLTVEARQLVGKLNRVLNSNSDLKKDTA